MAEFPLWLLANLRVSGEIRRSGFSYSRKILAIAMKRLVCGMMFAFGLAVMTTTGCGGSGQPEVIEETRTEAEIQQADDDYEKSMMEGEAESTSE